MRVKNGGHDIPVKDIIRRENDTIKNLVHIIDLIDDLMIIDNSDEDGEVVAEYRNNRIFYMTEKVPFWVQNILDSLKKRIALCYKEDNCCF